MLRKRLSGLRLLPHACLPWEVALLTLEGGVSGLGVETLDGLLKTRSYTGSGTTYAPFYYKIPSYKIVSMSICNIPISHSSTTYDILGEMFTLKL